jgi:putative two-component system response regulator
MVKAKILVVDDDLSILEIVSHAFDKNLYEIITLSDPTKTKDYVDLHRPDIIFLDLNMPVMSGQDVMLDLKNSGCGDTPIIFITADTDSDTHLDLCKLGACGLIVKPLNVIDLPLEAMPVIQINKLKKLSARLTDITHVS